MEIDQDIFRNLVSFIGLFQLCIYYMYVSIICMYTCIYYMYEYRDRLKINKIIKIKRLKSAEKYWPGIFSMEYLTFQSEAFYFKIFFIFIVRMFYT